jgi:hypothetical protein
MTGKTVRRLVTLGDDTNYRFQRHRLAREARDTGWFDRVDPLTQDDIWSFLEERREFVRDYPSGLGLWAWKPRVVLDALNDMEDGEMLVYLDAGSSIVRHRAGRLEDYGRILEEAELPFMVFSIPTAERCVQKRSVLRALGLEDNVSFLDSWQAEGGAIVALACDATRSFAQEWLGLCTADDHRLLRPEDELPQLEGFIEHRHDQSLLSALAKLRGAVILPFECYGEGPFFLGRMSDSGPRPMAADSFRREPGYDPDRHPTWPAYLDDPATKEDTLDRVRDLMGRVVAEFPGDDPGFDLQGELFSAVTAELARMQHVRGLWRVSLSIDEPNPDTAESARTATGEIEVWMRPGNPCNLFFRVDRGKIFFSDSKLFVGYLYKKEWSRQWDLSHAPRQT